MHLQQGCTDRVYLERTTRSLAIFQFKAKFPHRGLGQKLTSISSGEPHKGIVAGYFDRLSSYSKAFLSNISCDILAIIDHAMSFL